jgi:hypothetical protein
MAVERTGTASQVDASAGNSSTSVTVPADAECAVAFWTHFDDNGSTLATLTLGGNSFFATAFDFQLSVIDAATAEPGGGVAFLDDIPGTGTQTLAWTWSNGGARAEGGGIWIVWVKGQDATTPVRDLDADQGQSTTNVEATVDSQTTDLVLAMAQSTGVTPGVNGTKFVSDVSINSESYDLSEITAGASSTVATMTGENYSVIAAISLMEPQAPAAGISLAWIRA